MGVKYESRRLIVPWEGRHVFDLTAADLRPAIGNAVSVGSRGVIMSVEGESVPQIGLLALSLERSGVPRGAFLPEDQETHDAVETIAHSNPRRVSDVEDDSA